MKHIRCILICITLLYSAQAGAWNVEIKSSDSAGSTVWVSSDHAEENAEIYLVWYDQNAAEADMFRSWHAATGWEAGLSPVTQEPLDIPVLEALQVTQLDEQCPAEHRCFIAFIAITPGEDVLVSEKWRAASTLPLNALAGQSRLPGQTVFFTAEDIYRFTETANMDLAFAGANDGTGAAPPAADAEQAKDADESAPGTEKPDIFKIDGDQLLYVNGSAERFQVIDIADPAKPALKAWTALSGNPTDLYAIDGNYAFMLAVKEGTAMTTLQMNAADELNIIQEFPVSKGYLRESRRRGRFIYSVSEMSNSEGMSLEINVLQVDALGTISTADQTVIPGYDPKIAIFPDHLVIANRSQQDWGTTQIQVFDLAQADDPLAALPPLEVPGEVPSEFHLSVQNGQLRVVYDTRSAVSNPMNRTAGSTLAVYDLQQAALVGEISGIAPGESLFATRFAGDLAYVVTFERTDPLWVIDLSDPAAPAILGELEVPGWSEKLFFHEDRLFAVGIDDQPAANEDIRWARRVAVSLFDVADPTQPGLLGRFTPLTGEAYNSWSPALNDERALLLNWTDEFAALPLESWETNAGSHLQLVSFAGDQIVDAGRLDVNVPIQRSMVIGSDLLGVLGEQSFMTVDRSGGQLTLLGELELAGNITWLHKQDGNLWAAAMGNRGYYRLYLFDPDDLGTPVESRGLPGSYDGVRIDGNLAVFYSFNQLTIQAVKLDNAGILPARQLDAASDGGLAFGTSSRYDLNSPILHDGYFYIAEHKEQALPKPQPADLAVEEPLPMKEPLPADLAAEEPLPIEEPLSADVSMVEPDLIHPYYQAQWVLRSWKLADDAAEEQLTRSIPGNPLGINANGQLITKEANPEGLMRLNLLALEPGKARLLQSLELACYAYSSVIWTQQAVYINCMQEVYYYPMALAEDGSGGQTVNEPVTQLLRISVADGLLQQGRWTFQGQRELLSTTEDMVLLGPDYSYGYYEYGTTTVTANMATDDIAEVGFVSSRPMPPNYGQTSCEVYRLSGDQAVLLKALTACAGAEGVALAPDRAFIARGFAGIAAEMW
ncbi:MAG: hypothetical protein GY862_16080 [Gammaproteobacteria bacterium]|nr:hypothetical protein [Gammaproteobacteria bacterium]